MLVRRPPTTSTTFYPCPAGPAHQLHYALHRIRGSPRERPFSGSGGLRPHQGFERVSRASTRSSLPRA